jgi:hypothetical protein
MAVGVVAHAEDPEGGKRHAPRLVLCGFIATLSPYPLGT